MLRATIIAILILIIIALTNELRFQMKVNKEAMSFQDSLMEDLHQGRQFLLADGLYKLYPAAGYKNRWYYKPQRKGGDKNEAR